MDSYLNTVGVSLNTHSPELARIKHSCRCTHKCILSLLTPDDIAVWETILTRKTYQKNEMIFREGEPATGLYLVCKGMAKLSKSHSEGHQLIVRIIPPGNFFGLPPLICNRNHFTTAQAVDRLELEYIPRVKFIEFLRTHPNFTLQMIDYVARELCHARTLLRDFGCKSGRMRLADLLLWLSEGYGQPCPEGVQINIDLTRNDLAGMTGITTETTIRLLSAFRSEGLIANHRKRIVILDRERLKIEVGEDLLVDHTNIFAAA